MNGELTNSLKAHRGVRQGDPLSLFLFVLVMKYLHRILAQLRVDPKFKFHPKCHKLNNINLCFADDLLLFARGDANSAHLVLTKFEEFSNSTGLVANKNKCSIYYGGLTSEQEQIILNISGFSSGALPFKYLGVPIDNKKLTVEKFFPLISRITAQIKHWTSKLLSYAGRLQLVKSIISGIVAYWIQVFPIPKAVIKHIQAICRSFIWSSSDQITKKAPISSNKMCDPKNAGGLKIMDLNIWNLTMFTKLVWNISTKKDTLWVKWIHVYYMKGKSLQDMVYSNGWSWMFKNIYKSNCKCISLDIWNNLLNEDKFSTATMYKKLQGDRTTVTWRKLFFSNYARPHALFTLWMACHERLATKD